MLAYVFWHRPRTAASSTEYEDGLRAFHARVGVPSASFRIGTLPFGDGGAGYEDWYLINGWAEIGELNIAAVSAERRAPHDGVARLAADGWGAVYRLMRGDGHPPSATRWVSKPADQSYEAFLATTRAPAVWQRQMALGPAPEFCLVDDAASSDAAPRTAIYPQPSE